MWSRLIDLLPKVLEAVPHLERFSSAAEGLLSANTDRLLAANAVSNVANAATNASSATNHAVDTAAREALAEQIRKDLARVDTGNLSLSRQMDTLSAQVTTVGEAADGASRVTVALGHTIVAIERQLRALRALAVATLVLVVLLLVAVATLIVRAR